MQHVHCIEVSVRVELCRRDIHIFFLEEMVPTPGNDLCHRLNAHDEVALYTNTQKSFKFKTNSNCREIIEFFTTLQLEAICVSK